MVKKKPPKPFVRRNDAGLVATNFPLSMRWRLDQDYLDKLTKEERIWLAQFNTAYYSGDFRDFRDRPEAWPLPQRSDVNRSKNAAKTDAHGLAAAGLWGAEGLANTDELVEVLAGAPLTETPPSSEYLDTDEYKAARAEFRRHLAPGRIEAEPKFTPEYAKAYRRIRKLSPPHEQEAITPEPVPVPEPVVKRAAPKRRAARATPRRRGRGRRKG